jgi:hypothetical protein
MLHGMAALLLTHHLPSLSTAADSAPGEDGEPNEQEHEDCPASAYSALTGSTKLQYLDISGCTLPLCVWQHIFPADRHLPHLRSVNVSMVRQPAGGQAVAPDGTGLVRCCPGLQALDMQLLQCSTIQLGPLSVLTGLSALNVDYR